MAQKMNERWGKVADRFEEMVNDGRMQWREVKLDDLPSDWSKRVVGQFLCGEHPIKWWLGSVSIDGAICVKIDDKFLQYIDIFPNNTWQWCTDNHHSGVHPDRALEYLSAEKLGLPIKIKDVGPGRQFFQLHGETIFDWDEAKLRKAGLFNKFPPPKDDEDK